MMPNPGAVRGSRSDAQTGTVPFCVRKSTTAQRGVQRMGTEPTVTCRRCRTVVVVAQMGRGLPPDIATRRLVKACTAKGCPCDPVYRAGLDLR